MYPPRVPPKLRLPPLLVSRGKLLRCISNWVQIRGCFLTTPWLSQYADAGPSRGTSNIRSLYRNARMTTSIAVRKATNSLPKVEVYRILSTSYPENGRVLYKCQDPCVWTTSDSVTRVVSINKYVIICLPSFQVVRAFVAVTPPHDYHKNNDQSGFALVAGVIGTGSVGQR
jgi:hypothetical protein